MSPDEAHRQARLHFGHAEAIRESYHAESGVPWFENLLRDLRHALRELRHAPGFTLAAVLTIALGIGATTAVFTLIEQALLRPLPVPQPGQLWAIGGSDDCCYSARYAPGEWHFFSDEAYRFFRERNPEFSDLAAFQVGMGNAELAVRHAGAREPIEPRNGQYVSGNYFRTLGVQAWRGRLFHDQDDNEGAPPAAVMSYRTWQQKYGYDPSVVGAAFTINGHAFTIVGIAPPGFFGTRWESKIMPDFWLPLSTEPLIAGPTSRLKDTRTGWLDLIGRLKPEVNHAQLEVRIQAQLHQWLGSHLTDMTPEERALQPRQTVHLMPGGRGVSPDSTDYRSWLILLFAASACVLLVACANLANLLLARGLRNRPQTAIRAALGASRASLAQRALVESLVLSAIGAGAGLAVAWAGAKLILNLAFPASSMTPFDPTPSLPVLLFALGLSVATGLIFGIAPAWSASRTQPIEAIRTGTRTVAGGGTGRTQRMLLLAQTALSLVLVSMAALLGQSLRNMEHRDLGFPTAGLYQVSMDPKLSNYPQERLLPLFNEIEARMRAIPGVADVTAGLGFPPDVGYWSHDIRIAGHPAPLSEDSDTAYWTRVMPGYFAFFHDRIVSGRDFTADDNQGSRPVAVINEAFARRYFPHENPIGRHFGPSPGNYAGLYEIIGVAADFHTDLTPEGPSTQPRYFLPEAQGTTFAEFELENRELWSHDLYGVAILAPHASPGLEEQLRSALTEVDPDLIVYSVESFQDSMAEGFAQQRMILVLSSIFGLAALVLAAVGLYGVTAYSVQQRTGEMGVRMALGANRMQLLRLVLRSALGQSAIGIGIGLPLAILAGRALAGRLYGIVPWNPLILGGASLVLLLTALAAALIPARRAAAVDPMQALRSE
ncbi:ABC transporter permease [Silvibacterium dinghuense]|uniref:ABC transporter permease n=2 Tax=Silvibacterium dinghuense TaxID=1560006 RepID=A0A4Q1SKL9_9BACT|nr:ABC transporter permease [Silvibacterium dinghuense]